MTLPSVQKKLPPSKLQSFSIHIMELSQFTVEKLQKFAPAISALLLGAVLGFLVTKTAPDVLFFLIAGFIILLATFQKPQIIILLIIGANSTVFALNQVPFIKIGFRFSAIELCLFYLLALTLVQLLLNKENPYVKTPLDLPIALFFGVSLISFLYSIIYLGTNANLMEYQWRIFFGYLLFFVITNLVRTRNQLRTLLIGLVVLGSMVAILMVVQQVVGTSVKILPGRVEAATVFDNRYDTVARILPPGLSLILVLSFPTLLVLSSFEQINTKYFILLLVTFLLLIAETFTFNRGTWAGLMIAGIAVLLRVNNALRKRLVATLGLILGIGIIAFLIMSPIIPRISLIADAIGARANALFFTEQALSDTSWEWRVQETNAALVKVEQNPIIGIGPGNHYRPKWYTGDTLTQYVHNAYLFLLLDLGILGFIPFVLFSVLFLGRGFLLYPKIEDRYYRAIVLGVTAGYVAILIASIAAPIFMTWYWPPVLAAMFGVNEVIYQLNKKAGG